MPGWLPWLMEQLHNPLHWIMNVLMMSSCWVMIPVVCLCKIWKVMQSGVCVCVCVCRCSLITLRWGWGGERNVCLPTESGGSTIMAHCILLWREHLPLFPLRLDVVDLSPYKSEWAFYVFIFKARIMTGCSAVVSCSLVKILLSRYHAPTVWAVLDNSGDQSFVLE